MLTVAVYINSLPIILETAVNTGQSTEDFDGRKCYTYRDKDDCLIYHYREDGAAALAIKLLEKVRGGE